MTLDPSSSAPTREPPPLQRGAMRSPLPKRYFGRGVGDEGKDAATDSWIRFAARVSWRLLPEREGCLETLMDSQPGRNWALERDYLFGLTGRNQRIVASRALTDSTAGVRAEQAHGTTTDGQLFGHCGRWTSAPKASGVCSSPVIG